ncbi:hypothetical protein IE53DRAFT_385246 [Violaceomyces palustris]|uniref:Uncharacterized protein n=1 Tax=Violaceomyces palustris TaxID=1673888 RepID=A0ACD0P2Z8_9BASI|nr:hypothetical protein IE53DRAFT_385246 [Violaceomyces palustris]
MTLHLVLSESSTRSLRSLLPSPSSSSLSSQPNLPPELERSLQRCFQPKLDLQSPAVPPSPPSSEEVRNVKIERQTLVAISRHFLQSERARPDDLSSFPTFSSATQSDHPQEEWKEGLRLEKLLQGCQIWHPPKKVFVRSKELESTLSKIQLDQDRALYAKMTTSYLDERQRSSPYLLLRDPQPSRLSKQEESSEWQKVKSDLSVFFNILLSMLATSFAAWYALSWSDLSWRILISLLTSILVGVAEVALYARYSDYVRKSRDKKMRRMKGFENGGLGRKSTNGYLSPPEKDPSTGKARGT